MIRARRTVTRESAGNARLGLRRMANAGRDRFGA